MPPLGMLARLNALRPNLAPTAVRMAGYIVENAESVIQMSVIADDKLASYISRTGSPTNLQPP